MSLQSRAEQAGSGLPSTSSGDASEKKMDRAMKAKWLEALRNGKYTQGVGYLKSKNTFCCLGVLCDLSGEGTWREESDGINRYIINGNEGQRATLPQKIVAKYRVIGMGVLIEMNDGGKLFSEIADYIETKL